MELDRLPQPTLRGIGAVYLGLWQPGVGHIDPEGGSVDPATSIGRAKRLAELEERIHVVVVQNGGRPRVYDGGCDVGRSVK
eukprot:3748414-Prymnesium_polylepis.1